MAKKKSGKKKNIAKWQIFFLGVLTGIGIYWVPIDQEFTPAHFAKKDWSDTPSQSVFASSLPVSSPLIEREGYIASYDGRMRNAHWVYHRLTPQSVKTRISRDECEFKEDPLIPEPIRATKADYKGSGFDRGHLCAAADTGTPLAMENSFFLTNIAPQTPAFNRGYWKKVEQHVRKLTREYQVVHAFTGPLYMSTKGRNGKRYVKYEVIGKSEVAVPTHFFTLIFVELPTKKMMAKAYIVPNKAIEPKTPLKKYLATVEEVESASGIMFTHIIQ